LGPPQNRKYLLSKALLRVASLPPDNSYPINQADVNRGGM